MAAIRSLLRKAAPAFVRGSPSIGRGSPALALRSPVIPGLSPAAGYRLLSTGGGGTKIYSREEINQMSAEFDQNREKIHQNREKINQMSAEFDQNMEKIRQIQRRNDEEWARLMKMLSRRNDEEWARLMKKLERIERGCDIVMLICVPAIIAMLLNM